MDNNTKKKIAAFLISVGLVTGVSNYEGFRDTAYVPVPGDKITIGGGFTTREDGSPVQFGDKITRNESDIRLTKDLYSYRVKIGQCIKVSVSEGQANAFTSLSFNIGTGAFCNSTLVKKLNQYDYQGACQEILRWNLFQGKPLKGLTIRRQGEYKQCLS